MANKLRIYAPGETVKAIIGQGSTHWAAGAGSPSMVADSARTTAQWQSDLITLTAETNASSADTGWRSATIPALPAALITATPYRALFYSAGSTPNPGDPIIGSQEFYWDGTAIVPDIGSNALPGLILNNPVNKLVTDSSGFAAANIQSILNDANAALGLKSFNGAIVIGTVTGGDAGNVQSNLPQATGFWDNSGIMFITGNLKSVARTVTAYNATNGNCTLDATLPQVPQVGDTFVLIGHYR